MCVTDLVSLMKELALLRQQQSCNQSAASVGGTSALLSDEEQQYYMHHAAELSVPAQPSEYNSYSILPPMKKEIILKVTYTGIPCFTPYLGVGYITPTKHLTPNFTLLVSLT